MDDWLFPSPKNEAVFTLATILRGQRPVLAVFHDDDGAWQFLDGSDAFDKTDAVIVSLEEMTNLDPSLFALADLSEGWVA